MSDLDSRSKRASSVQVLMPFVLAPVQPDGAIGAADRQHIVWMYAAGILTSEATMSSLSVSLAVKINNVLVPITPAYRENDSANAPMVQQFELAAGYIREIVFDTGQDGDSLTFLLIAAVLDSDGTTPAEVSISFTDGATSEASFTDWHVINGLGGGLWEIRDLSVANKLFIYNSGSARIRVTLIADTEGY